jgi:hypothetical protein
MNSQNPPAARRGGMLRGVIIEAADFVLRARRDGVRGRNMNQWITKQLSAHTWMTKPTPECAGATVKNC